MSERDASDRRGAIRAREIAESACSGTKSSGQIEFEILEVLEAEKAAARETITRLNRRCQIAEKAANTKVEDAEKRSKKGIRAYLFELGRIHGHCLSLTGWMGSFGVNNSSQSRTDEDGEPELALADGCESRSRSNVLKHIELLSLTDRRIAL